MGNEATEIKKTLMKIRTATFAGDHALMTVDLDGKIVYGQPMTADEIKATFKYAIENKIHGQEVILALLFASELCRLNREIENLEAENTDLKVKLEAEVNKSVVERCETCGEVKVLGFFGHICKGKE